MWMLRPLSWWEMSFVLFLAGLWVPLWDGAALGGSNGVKSLQRKTTSAYKSAVTSAKCDPEWAEQAGGGTGATACPGRCVSAKHLQ